MVTNMLSTLNYTTKLIKMNLNITSLLEIFSLISKRRPRDLTGPDSPRLLKSLTG